MACSEAALGRPLRVGADQILSEDEHLLIDLLAGTKRTRACLDCDDGMATTLDGAVCSTRIMMALAVPASSGRAALH